MGQDKALLPLPRAREWGERTFVEHLTTMLATLCSEVVVVARDSAQATQYVFPGVSLVTDDLPDCGPLMGIASGLRTIRAARALVMAVDLPFVQPSLVSLLLELAQDDTLLVPLVDTIPQVLLAVYPRTILPLVEERLLAGRRDPRSLLDVAPVRFVEEDQLRRADPLLRSFINVNTPEDLTRLS